MITLLLFVIRLYYAVKFNSHQIWYMLQLVPILLWIKMLHKVKYPYFSVPLRYARRNIQYGIDAHSVRRLTAKMGKKTRNFSTYLVYLTSALGNVRCYLIVFFIQFGIYYTKHFIRYNLKYAWKKITLFSFLCRRCNGYHHIASITRDYPSFSSFYVSW